MSVYQFDRFVIREYTYTYTWLYFLFLFGCYTIYINWPIQLFVILLSPTIILEPSWVANSWCASLNIKSSKCTSVRPSTQSQIGQKRFNLHKYAISMYINAYQCRTILYRNDEKSWFQLILLKIIIAEAENFLTFFLAF